MPDTHTTTTFLRRLFGPGDVLEIRVLGAVNPSSTWEHTQSGYFEYDQVDTIPNALANLRSYRSVYYTLNPVNPDLLARACNRLEKAQRGATTGDADILVRRRFLIDVDPVRPAGISSTGAEKVLAFDRAVEIREGLTSMGWPAPIIIDSGNGTQLIYAVDLPTDDAGLLKCCLEALQSVSTDKVHIDLAVHNASRIARLPGTWNRKGDSITTRPHRLSEVLDMPEQIVTVTRQQLEHLAGQSPGVGRESIEPSATDVTDASRILEQHGWMRLTTHTNGDQEWRRPGKADGGKSATLFASGVFHVFSDNAAPFGPGQAYGPDAVAALLAPRDEGVDLSGILAQNASGSPVSQETPLIATVSASTTGVPTDGNIGDAPRKKRFTRFDQIEVRAPEWLIDDVIEADSTAMIFGDPGSGKSFVALDWACRIASGTPWRGFEVEQAPVGYILGEGQAGLGRRIKAWQEHNGISLDKMPIHAAHAVPMPDELELASLIRDIAEEIGQPALVVVDTLARNFGPGDENNTQDMSRFIAACDRVRRAFGCTILIIHHTGHGEKTRARGAMALKAALDAEYRLERNADDRILLAATKMKDAELPEQMRMELITVTIPGLFDKKGRAVTSAAIEYLDADLSGILSGEPTEAEVSLDDFIANCVEPYDPCSKSMIQNHASTKFGMSRRKSEGLFTEAVERERIESVLWGKSNRYVLRRADLVGEKALLTAALLARSPDADVQDIASQVDVSARYVRRVRARVFPADGGTGAELGGTEFRENPRSVPGQGETSPDGLRPCGTRN